jgi:hypothetical protein
LVVEARLAGVPADLIARLPNYRLFQFAIGWPSYSKDTRTVLVSRYGKRPKVRNQPTVLK